MEGYSVSDSCSPSERKVPGVVPAIENSKEIVEEEPFSVFRESEVATNVNLQDSFGTGSRIADFDSAVEEGQELVVRESGFDSQSDYSCQRSVEGLSECGSRNEVFSELKEMQEIEKSKSNSISVFQSDNNYNAMDSFEARGIVDSLRAEECSGNVTVIEEKQSAGQDDMSSSRICEENSVCFVGGKENQLESTPEAPISGIKECLEIPSEIKGKHEPFGVEAQITDEKWSGLWFRSIKGKQEFVENEGKETNGLMENKGHVGFEAQIMDQKRSDLWCRSINGKQEFVEYESKEINGLMENEEHVGDSLKIEGKEEMPEIQFHLASVSEKESNSEKKDLGFVNLGKNVSEMNDKKNSRQEITGKKDICLKRRTKGEKKAADLDEKKKVSSLLDEAQNVCQNKEGGIKKIYPRKELEALRFLNAEGQKKLWNEIYLRLGPAVARELDDMVNTKNHKQARLNVDQCQRRRNKKEQGPILSEVCHESNFEVGNSLDISYDHRVSGEDGCTVVEGECIEDWDSDDEFDSILRPAFIIEGEPNFESGPPQDGLEYLRRVRWEAAQIPKVKVSKLDRRKFNSKQTIYMPKIPHIPNCPEHLLPLKQWEDAFLTDFSALRLAMSRLEHSDSNNIDHLLPYVDVHEDYSFHPLQPSAPEDSDEVPSALGMNEDGSCKHVESNNLESSQNRELLLDISQDASPTLSTILGMDYVSRASMLRRRISLLETKDSLSRNDCLWLYVLCMAIDTPLDADTSASLRCLLRKCASLRAEKSGCDVEVVMLNILVTISGRYFGQLEN